MQYKTAETSPFGLPASVKKNVTIKTLSESYTESRRFNQLCDVKIWISKKSTDGTVIFGKVITAQVFKRFFDLYGTQSSSTFHNSTLLIPYKFSQQRRNSLLFGFILILSSHFLQCIPSDISRSEFPDISTTLNWSP